MDSPVDNQNGRPIQSSVSVFFRRASRSTLAHNVVSLYGSQIALYLFPLLAIPYLARVLGVYTWGLVAFAQAFGSYVNLIVEFGFSLSATRDVARNRDDRERLSDVVAGVFGAKAVLALLCVIAAAMLQELVPQFRRNPLIFWCAIAWGIAQAFSMIWYYQGLERMRTSSAIDILTKSLGLAGIFILVHSPAQAWRVLGVQALASIIGTSLMVALAYRELRCGWPSPRSTWQAMRMGGNTFLLRSAVSIYTTANVIIAGFFGSPVAVGYYAGGEKVARGFLSLMNPLSLSLYPRLAHLIRHAQSQAVRLVRVSFIVMGCGGAMLAGVLYLAAPFVVRVVLGAQFLPAVPVVRILCVLVPAVAVSNVLGLQWMLPCGLDKECNWIVAGAGVMNITLACLLAPKLGAVGVSIAVAVTEISVAMAFYVLLTRRKMNPFQLNSSGEDIVVNLRMDESRP